jgi:hypothetical protein
MPEGVNQSKRGRALFVEWLVRQLASLYLSISVTARMAAGGLGRRLGHDALLRFDSLRPLLVVLA